MINLYTMSIQAAFAVKRLWQIISELKISRKLASFYFLSVYVSLSNKLAYFWDLVIVQNCDNFGCGHKHNEKTSDACAPQLLYFYNM
jgi:hypothetical protein